MLFALDIGNTHSCIGVFEGEKLRNHWRIASDKAKTADEYAVLIHSLLALCGLSFRTFEAVAISCVVPPLLQTFEELCARHLSVTPLVVGPGTRTGMPILMDNPREVGADRIVNAVAAYHRVRRACIVVDFGTATTFDCISAKGDYLGGVIVPGISISLEALVQMASKLPRVEIARPRTVIGKNTVHSMQSGILYGYVGLVDGMAERIRKEMGEDAYVIATGGLAARVAPESRAIQEVDELLTLKGLQILYHLNRKEA
ncbi:MAG: type III pantothenate kinase [bacterium]